MSGGGHRRTGSADEAKTHGRQDTGGSGGSSGDDRPNGPEVGEGPATVDVRAILRLGGKALVMMLAGSVGIILGGPIAYGLLGRALPPDTWMGLAALSGSRIGGAPNMVAIKGSVGTPDSVMAPIIVVDTVVAYSWMGLLLLMTAWQQRFNDWVRADTTAIDALNQKLAVTDRERRPADVRHLAMILALGFGGPALAIWPGDHLPPLGNPTIISHTTWAVVLVTDLRASAVLHPGHAHRDLRHLAGGISRALFDADCNRCPGQPQEGLGGAAVPGGQRVVDLHSHAVLILVAKLIRAPLFFVATSSMANIGGPASAPVVARHLPPGARSGRRAHGRHWVHSRDLR